MSLRAWASCCAVNFGLRPNLAPRRRAAFTPARRSFADEAALQLSQHTDHLPVYIRGLVVPEIASVVESDVEVRHFTWVKSMKAPVRCRITLLACLVMEVVVPDLNADAIESAVSVGFCAFEGTTGLSCPVGSSDSQKSLLNSAETTFSGPLSDGSGDGVNVTGSTSSDEGVLKGSLTTVVTSGVPPATQIYGEAYALMIDTITVSEPNLNGQTGSLVLGLAADGTESGSQLVSPGVYTSAGVDLYAGGAVPGFPGGTPYFANGSFSVPSYLGPTTSFTFGQPFSIEWYFEATSGAYCTNASACASWNSNGVAASVDASDTVVLNSVSVYDNRGALVSPSAWSVTSASGLQYGPTGIVPEPTFWLPLIAILGVLGVKTRLRARSFHRATIKSRHEQSHLHFASHGN
jgi:hypothetical protein